MKIVYCALWLLCSLGVSYQATAQDKATRTKHYNLEKTLAIEGYDPVAYITEKKAIEGKSALSYNHQGVVYHFSSQKNLETFKLTPEKFEPMYGGWCAYAMGSSGEKVEVDPETFKVVNGKLYLFYNKYFNNTLTKWDKEEFVLMKKADTNWKKIAQ
jgi:YHS domain-containing protein